MEEHVAHEGELQEEKMTQAINTPAVTTRQTCKEQYCNVNQNNEIIILIIFQHINMIFFVDAVDARS